MKHQDHKPVRLIHPVRCVNCGHMIPKDFLAWMPPQGPEWHAGMLEVLCIATSGYVMQHSYDVRTDTWDVRRQLITIAEQANYEARAKGLRFDIKPYEFDEKPATTQSLSDLVYEQVQSMYQAEIRAREREFSRQYAAIPVDPGPYFGSKAGRAHAGIDAGKEKDHFTLLARYRPTLSPDAFAKVDRTTPVTIDIKVVAEQLDKLKRTMKTPPPPRSCGGCGRALISGGSCLDIACSSTPAVLAKAGALADKRIPTLGITDADRAAWARALRDRLDASTRARFEREARRVGWDPYGDD